MWYDNDKSGAGDQRNTDMVLKVCQAMDLFKDKLLVEFKIGAGSSVRIKIYHSYYSLVHFRCKTANTVYFGRSYKF